MMDFKKSFFYGYTNIKWCYFVLLFILAITYAITDANELTTASLVSLFLLFIVGFGGLIGTKISGKLKTLKLSWKSLLKNMGIYTVASIIFFIAQIALVIIGVFLISLLVSTSSLTSITSIEELIYSLPSGLLVFMILIFLVFGFLIFVLELLKTMGIVKYFKTNKFKDIFRIKKYFKAIFTKDYFTIAFFVVGYAIITIIAVSIIYLLLSIFTDTIAMIIVNFLAIVIMYTVTSAHYSLISDYLVDKK